MIEPEIAFADLSDDADLAEDFLKRFSARCSMSAAMTWRFSSNAWTGCIERLEKFVDASFERMDYTDAIARLEKAVADGHKFEFPELGMDCRANTNAGYRGTHRRPVVVMNYPKDIKAFYMRMNDDGNTVAAMDVLAPGIGEIIGGSQREERLDVLDARLEELDLEKDDYWWYRDLRKYGTVPHAGFGLGFERTLIYATGMANVRDVIPFPRTPRNADF